MGELLAALVYRGGISDLNLATKTGYYEMGGTVINAPFEASWGPVLVFGNRWIVKMAFNITSDTFKCYIYAQGYTGGWKQMSLT